MAFTEKRIANRIRREVTCDRCGTVTYLDFDAGWPHKQKLDQATMDATTGKHDGEFES